MTRIRRISRSFRDRRHSVRRTGSERGRHGCGPAGAKYSCTACHAADKKIGGRLGYEVAAKHAGDLRCREAPAEVEWRQRFRGAITPPNNVPDADLKTLVEWVLATK
jgi:cytochrome c